MNEIFAQNLKSLRKQHNLSQQQLADHLNVHIGSITKWEKNGVRPRTQKINEIAEFFNVSADELRGAKVNSEGMRKRLSKTELKKHKTIGQKLKALREHFDMNYTDLGNEIGATSYTVSKWEKESSKPYNDAIHRLADFFGVEYEELAGEPPKTNPIGNQIKSLRTEAELSREELSEKMGMSTQSIYSWEQGKTTPRSKALQKLAEIFNVSPEDIMGKSDLQEADDFLEDDLLTDEFLIEEEMMADHEASDSLVEEMELPLKTGAEILEFPTLQNEPAFPLAISRDNEIIDLEVLFTSSQKRLVIGDSLLTAEEKLRALNVLMAVFQK